MPSNKSKTKPKHNFSFEAIGTLWSIDLYGDFSKELKNTLIQQIEEFDRNYSRFRDDSLVSQIAKKPGTYQLPDDAAPMLDLYKKLYKVTDGLVTPLVGQVLSDAGYDKKYSFTSHVLYKPPSWEEAIQYKNGKLTVLQPVLLDFGAVGKGYLVDLLAKTIEHHGISSFCIDASGDVLCKNLMQPEKIGLENPDDISSVVGTIGIVDGALCGSAINRRAWGNYHHIMNPKTLRSQEGIKAIWVTANATALADGLSTALFFCDAKTLMKHFDFDYALIRSDNSIEYSPNFAGTFFD